MRHSLDQFEQVGVEVFILVQQLMLRILRDMSVRSVHMYLEAMLGASCQLTVFHAIARSSRVDADEVLEFTSAPHQPENPGNGSITQ